MSNPNNSSNITATPTATTAAEKSPRKAIFTRELKLMMYGYGDVPNPRQDTLELMEEMVMDYLYDLCSKATKVASNRKVKIEDFLFLLRKDHKKHNRAQELLFRFDELLKARKAFETNSED